MAFSLSLVVCVACLFSSSLVRAGVTVYGLQGQTVIQLNSQPTTTTAIPTTSYLTDHGPPQFTGPAAYNQIFLAPPAPPDPAPATAFAINVPQDASLLQGLSIMVNGTFFGFSIEMSVVDQLIGSSSKIINPIFLNFMSIIAERAGAVHVRVGGNTQDTAYIVESLPDGKFIEKDKEHSSNPTGTPVLAFTADFIYMLGNVTSLVPVKWYLGIPFNDTNWRFQIAEIGETVLGDNLLGFQASNEPDLYQRHGHRPDGWGPQDYFNEFGMMSQAWKADTSAPVKNRLIAPSISTGWTLDQVWDTNFVDAYTDVLSMISVEHYPSDNCAVMYPDSGIPFHDPLDELSQYLSHQAALNLVNPYLDASARCIGWGKPFIMFETNTASCGGFPGISDSFTSSLWGLDYALQMVYANFSSALFHFGGQDVAYNPFTAAPTNMSRWNDWTVGPIFYSGVVVAEALGKTGTAQVKDLFPNNGDDQTPAYAIYENGQLARMVLINYMTDASGAHDYIATLSVGGGGFGEANAVPPSVKVKYLVAPSVSEKDNITWAGQTLGGHYHADGRWRGNEDVQTVPCDTAANACSIHVPAPGAALVFFTDAAQSVASASPAPTFATTAVTRTRNTATIDAAVLATSNGNSGRNRGHGGTSDALAFQGAGAVPARAAPSVGVLFGALVGVLMLLG